MIFQTTSTFVSAQIDQLPLSTEAIAFETQQDPELSTLFQALEQGKDLKTLGFKGNQLEYSIVQGCLMLGHRVVIPQKFRQKLLDELHLAHLGITKMKGIARSIIYWPNIDKDIESIAKSCIPCLENSRIPPKCNNHVWEYPKKP